MRPDTGLLDIEAVAKWLGTSHRHVRRLVAERRVPYLKVGHFVRFDQEAIATWINQHRVEMRGSEVSYEATSQDVR